MTATPGTPVSAEARRVTATPATPASAEARGVTATPPGPSRAGPAQTGARVTATPPSPSRAGPAQTGARLTEDDPLTEVGESFKAAMGAVRRLRGRETRYPDKLSYAQYSLLFGLAAKPQLPASQLAAVADLAPATVTEMLDHLESDGLVERVRSEQDKRVVLVSLTRRGRRLVGQRRAHLERRWREALAEFDDEQMRSAAAVLDRLRGLFDELASD